MADSFSYDSDGTGVWFTASCDVHIDAGDYIKLSTTETMPPACLPPHCNRPPPTPCPTITPSGRPTR
jgi:hypothetical protein